MEAGRTPTLGGPMSDTYDTTRFRYRLGARLAHYPTLLREIEKPKSRTRLTIERFGELQEKLYADDRYSLLIIVQGMDTAGKDSTIKRVTSGVNPQGFQVVNFKQPTYEDLDHNYLWRYWRASGGPRLQLRTICIRTEKPK